MNVPPLAMVRLVSVRVRRKPSDYCGFPEQTSAVLSYFATESLVVVLPHVFPRVSDGFFILIWLFLKSGNHFFPAPADSFTSPCLVSGTLMEASSIRV